MLYRPPLLWAAMLYLLALSLLYILLYSTTVGCTISYVGTERGSYRYDIPVCSL